MIWHNIATAHHRWFARFLRRRGWVCLYLDERSRHCSADCWLRLYEEGERREHEPRGFRWHLPDHVEPFPPPTPGSISFIAQPPPVTQPSAPPIVVTRDRFAEIERARVVPCVRFVPSSPGTLGGPCRVCGASQPEHALDRQRPPSDDHPTGWPAA